MNVKLRQLITKVPPRHVQLQQGEKEEEGVAQHKRSKELCSFVQQQLLQLCKDKVRRRRKRISRPLCIFTQVHRSKVTQWWFFSERSLISGGGSFAKQNKRTVSRSKHELWSNNGGCSRVQKMKTCWSTDFKAGDTLSVFSGKKPCLAKTGESEGGEFGSPVACSGRAWNQELGPSHWPCCCSAWVMRKDKVMAERERRVAVVVGAIHQACTKTHTWTQEELHKPSSPSLVPSLTPHLSLSYTLLYLHSTVWPFITGVVHQKDSVLLSEEVKKPPVWPHLLPAHLSKCFKSQMLK